MWNLICEYCGVGIYFEYCKCSNIKLPLKSSVAKEILKFKDAKSYRKISLTRKCLPVIRYKSPLSKTSIVFCY